VHTSLYVIHTRLEGCRRLIVTRGSSKPMNSKDVFADQASVAHHLFSAIVGIKVISVHSKLVVDIMSAEPTNDEFKITDIDEETLNSGAEG